MSSSIRNIRDHRYSAKTRRDSRGLTKDPATQKTYDANFTAHDSNVKIPADNGLPSRTDPSVDHVHEIARDQLVPMIQTMSANAVLVDRREFYYFQRKKVGRRCSCYTIESSPDNSCQVCYGVGIVGGYEKFGTISETIDFTTPDLLMVNCEPAYGADSRPVFLQLKDGFNSGYVEATLPIKQNIGAIDTYYLYQPLYTQGTQIFASNSTGSGEIKKLEDFEPYLADNKITVRIVFNRINNSRPQKHLMSHFMLRYKTQAEQLVYGDIPKSDSGLTLTNVGVFDSYTELSIFFDGKTVRTYGNEDLLYRLYDGKRFKIVQVTPNIVANILTSIDTRARFLIPGMDVGALSVLA